MAEENKENPNYPKVLYHRSNPPVTVHSEEEHQEYAPEEWAETPAAFEKKPAAKPPKKTEPAAPTA